MSRVSAMCRPLLLSFIIAGLLAGCEPRPDFCRTDSARVRVDSDTTCDCDTRICYRDGAIDKTDTEAAFGERAGRRADSIRDATEGSFGTGSVQQYNVKRRELFRRPVRQQEGRPEPAANDRREQEQRKAPREHDAARRQERRPGSEGDRGSFRGQERHRDDDRPREYRPRQHKESDRDVSHGRERRGDDWPGSGRSYQREERHESSSKGSSGGSGRSERRESSGGGAGSRSSNSNRSGQRGSSGGGGGSDCSGKGGCRNN
jgi:hypothetical protein